MSVYKWLTPMHNTNDSVKTIGTEYSSVYSSKSNCGARSSYRTPSTTTTTISSVRPPETHTSYIIDMNQEEAQASPCRAHTPNSRFNPFSWLFRTIHDYIYKTRVRVSANNSVEPDQEERIVEDSLIHNTSDAWKNKDSMSNCIVELTNRYKNNRDLYDITNKIRNCISLSVEDVDNIMHFNKNEILTIILLQNYCLEHHRENMELLIK
jgi:hypothetical protein